MCRLGTKRCWVRAELTAEFSQKHRCQGLGGMWKAHPAQRGSSTQTGAPRTHPGGWEPPEETLPPLWELSAVPLAVKGFFLMLMQTSQQAPTAPVLPSGVTEESPAPPSTQPSQVMSSPLHLQPLLSTAVLRSLPHLWGSVLGSPAVPCCSFLQLRAVTPHSPWDGFIAERIPP